MEKLNEEQVEKIKTFIDLINKAEGRDVRFDDHTLSLLTGTYKIIEKMGGGCPVKAAEWRLGTNRAN